MGSVGTLVVAGGGAIPGILRDEIKCWNKFKLISDNDAGGSESVTGS